MTAEFAFHPQGNGGGNPTPTPKSKGFTISKPMLYIGGGALIVIFLLLKGRQNSNVDTTSTNDPSVSYPSNSVDYQSALQNNNDIMTSQMNSALGQFQTQMQQDYDTQLQALSTKMDAFQSQMDTLNSHPNPGSTTEVSTQSQPQTAATAPAKSTNMFRLVGTDGSLEDTSIGTNIYNAVKSGASVQSNAANKQLTAGKTRYINSAGKMVDTDTAATAAQLKKEGYIQMEKG